MAAEITLTPAYGRDYSSKAKAIAAIEAGADFIINCFGHPYDGRPCSPKSDLAGSAVKVRHGKLRKVFIHKL